MNRCCLTICTLALVFSTIGAARADQAAGLSAEEQDQGYVSLFNGANLDGWQGATDGYEASDGLLKCKGETGGNLFTDKQYGDFSLRLEFKFPPGANNGVAIRAPLEGNPAHDGMEIQILDHDHPQYKDIKPWQAHGSIYGVVAAKRGHLKPTGEWNQQEIIADGDHIIVKLNGVVIVDADIKKASTPKTIDGRPHPGLERDKGYIGFCGHGHDVDFRNLRVKEL